jgi:Fe2+ or Zn2+ uptake regulation protein
MKDATQRLAWALQACRQLHMRLTPGREKILGFLAKQRVPVSLNTLMQAEELRGVCDATTAYRTLTAAAGGGGVAAGRACRTR